MGYDGEERRKAPGWRAEDFERWSQLETSVELLRQELEHTRSELKRYNGLREQLSDTCRRLDVIEVRALGRAGVGVAIREWGGWILAIVVSVAALWRQVGGGG